SCTGATTISGDMTILSGGFDTVSQTITTTGGTAVYGTLRIGTGKYVATGELNANAAGSAIDFTGTGSAGTLEIKSTVAGNSFNNLDNSAGTVEYSSSTAAQNIVPTTYYALKINKTGQQGNCTGATTTNGPLAISAGTLAVGASDLSVGGNLTASAGSFLTVSTGRASTTGSFDATGATVTLSAAGGRLYLGGDVIALGTFTAAVDSIVRYNGSSAQTVKGVAYHHLEINKGGGSVGTLDAAATVAGNLTVMTGVLSIADKALSVTGAGSVASTLRIGTGTATVTGSFGAAGAVEFTAAGRLRLGSTVTAIGSLTNNVGTTEYYGNGADQTIFPITYFNVRVDKDTKTAAAMSSLTLNGGLILVAGTFRVGDGATFPTVTVAGDILASAGTTISIPGAGAGGPPILNCRGAFNAADANVSLGGANSRLYLGGAVASLGSFTAAAGATVRYDSTTTDQSVLGVSYSNLEFANTGRIATAAGAVTVGANLTSSSGTFATGAATVVVTGTATVSGATLRIDTGGTLDANGTFNATGGNVTFAGAGTLELSSTVTSLGTLTPGSGTVKYNSGANQDVPATTFNHLEISKAAGQAILAAGSTVVGGQLIFSAGELVVGGNSVRVDGSATIGGTLSVGAGTADFNGSLSSTGTIGVAASGTLEVSGEVSSFGTLNANATSTVRYNRTTGSQTVQPATYGHLRFSNTGQTATLSGDAVCAGTLAVESGTLAVADSGVPADPNELAVTGAVTLAGRLTLTGVSSLRLGVSLSVQSGGTLRTTMVGSDRPTITKTAAAASFGFTAQSGSAVYFQGLNFSYCNGNGLRIESGTTVTDIDDVICTNGVNTGAADTYLNFRLAAQGGSYSFSNCSFDMAVPGFEFAVTTDSLFSGSVEVLNGAGATEANENDNEAGVVSPGRIVWPVYKLWTGGGGNDNWANGNNWNPLGEPGLIDNVKIPNVGANPSPRIYANASAKMIEITTGTLTMQDAVALNVYGDFVCGAGGTLNFANGTVAFRGDSSGQFITLPAAQSLRSVEINKNAGMVQALSANVAIAGTMTVTAGKFSTGSSVVTVSGASSMGGQGLEVATGEYRANSSYDAGAGSTTFTGSGKLRLGANPVSLGTFTAGNGTVEYADTTTNRTVLAHTYYDLTIATAGFTAAAGASFTVSNALTITSGTFSGAGFNIAVNGATSVGGTMSIPSGSVDANGSFGGAGTVSITANGTLELGGSVTALGVAAAPVGLVKYNNVDANQTVFVTNYDRLEIAVGTRIASAGGNVSTAGNLTVTSGTFAVGGQTVTCAGSTSVTAGAYVTIGAGLYDANGSFGAAGGYVQLTAAGGRLYLAGSVTSLGNFSAAAGAVTRYDSTTVDQSVQAVSYANLEFANTGFVATAAGSFTIGGALSVAAGANFSVGASTVGVTGAATADGRITVASGTLDANGALAINGPGGELFFTNDAGKALIGAGFTMNGTFTRGNGTVTYDSGGAQSVLALAYHNLEIAKGAATGTLAGNLTGGTALTGGLKITSGVFDAAGFNVTVAGAFTNDGTLQATTSTVDVGGAFTSNGNVTYTTGNLYLRGAVDAFASFTAGTGTVSYRSTGVDQIVRPVSYYRLEIDKSAKVANCGGSFAVGAGGFSCISGTFSTGSYTVTVGGAITLPGGTLSIGTGTLDANGSFTAAGGTLTFAGAGRLQLGSGSPASFGTFSPGTGTIAYDDTAGAQNVLAVTYCNLEIAKNAQTASLTNATTVTGTLEVVSGILATGANQLTAGSAGSGSLTITSGTLQIGAS
ncbi:MAG: hypothetical protein RDV41_09935, partial [Planctomycetota bacterium]|nr:hypothetical protein [Planctomycetota bacterium]